MSLAGKIPSNFSDIAYEALAAYNASSPNLTPYGRRPNIDYGPAANESPCNLYFVLDNFDEGSIGGQAYKAFMNHLGSTQKGAALAGAAQAINRGNMIDVVPLSPSVRLLNKLVAALSLSN